MEHKPLLKRILHVRHNSMKQLVHYVIEYIERQLDQKPSLTTIIVNTPDNLKTSLILVKALTDGGLKASLRTGMIQSYIQIELPSLDTPRTKYDAPFLKRILKFRELLIYEIETAIIIYLENQLKNHPLLEQVDVDIYEASKSTDYNVWPLVVQNLVAGGLNATLETGYTKSYIHFDLSILEFLEDKFDFSDDLDFSDEIVN